MIPPQEDPLPKPLSDQEQRKVNAREIHRSTCLQGGIGRMVRLVGHGKNATNGVFAGEVTRRQT